MNEYASWTVEQIQGECEVFSEIVTNRHESGLEAKFEKKVLEEMQAHLQSRIEGARKKLQNTAAWEWPISAWVAAEDKEDCLQACVYASGSTAYVEAVKKDLTEVRIVCEGPGANDNV